MSQCPPLSPQQRDAEFFACMHKHLTLEEIERYAWLANDKTAQAGALAAADELEDAEGSANHAKSMLNERDREVSALKEEVERLGQKNAKLAAKLEEHGIEA